jgi:hypothetical protein
MKRLHLFEIEDQPWCPRTLRDSVTDYLQFTISAMEPYKAMIPILAAALQRTGSGSVVDLCSGAGGPWICLQPALTERGLSVSVCLTDIYPNMEAFARACRITNQGIRFHGQPVDATQVPSELRGFRTMFTAFHHFNPEQASRVLADAVRQRQGIGIFEVTERRARAMLLIVLAPLMILLVTPLIRPFRWSRLFWTYIIPLVPIVTLFDGLVSCLRTYSPQELKELTGKIAATDYAWEIGTAKGEKKLITITYLIGVPIQKQKTNDPDGFSS